jgi:hypothetical protein
MTKKISVSYFPIGLKYASPLLFVVAIYLIVINHPVWAIISILLAFCILTTRYVTEIDMNVKEYRDYLSMFGISFNKEIRNFKSVDRIVITKGNYSQTINTKVQSRQMDWSDYTGTVIFDHDQKLDLLTKNSKKDLLLGLREFWEFLDVDVEDLTTNQPYFIDMRRIEK